MLKNRLNGIIFGVGALLQRLVLPQLQTPTSYPSTAYWYLHAHFLSGHTANTKSRYTKNFIKELVLKKHKKDANEGPMRIQYKCLVAIVVFPEMKLRGLVISKTEFIMFYFLIFTVMYL
jgi:hypothetical protein